MSLADKYKNLDQTASLADKYAHLNQNEQAKTADTSGEEPGRIDALLTGLAQGSTLGLSDELAGAVNAPVGAAKTIANLVGANYNDADVEAYKARRDASRAANAAAEEAHPGYALAGNIVGGAIPMALASPLASGSMVAQGIKAGAMAGAGYGLGQSNEENLKGLAKDAATGGAIGGALGGASSQLGKFLMGNAPDAANGITSKVQKGAIPEFADSKLGGRFKGFFKAGQTGADTATEAAEAARGVQNKEAAGNILDVAQQKSQEVGKEIGNKVNAAGPMKPTVLEEVMPQLPKVVQEQVMEVLPGRITKASQAPQVLQDELNATEKGIQKIIEANPEDAVKNFQKVSTDLVDPAILEGELQYNQVGQEQANRIKQALQENPTQTLQDLYNTIINKEAPSADLDDLFQQIKFKSVVQKLAKEAQVNTGAVPQPIQDLQNLLNKKSALKKAVSQFGKTEVQEPSQMVSNVITKLDDTHIAESDKVPARKLKDIISKYVGPDGTVAPEKSVEFRNSLNHFTKNTDSYEIGNLARKLGSEIGDIRRERAGDLSGQFHDIKSFADMLKIDTSGMSENEIKNAVAPRFAKFLEKSESTANMESGRMQDLVDKFVEATGNDPQIAKNLQVIADNAKLSELHKVKSGSTGSMFHDGVNRLAFAFPLETAGQISANPVVKAVAGTTQTAATTLMNLPAAGWRNIAAKTSTTSPTISKIANQVADATDEGKKRALLNVLNQMPTFRKAIENIGGAGNE